MFNEAVAKQSKLPKEIIDAMRQSANEDTSILGNLTSNMAKQNAKQKTVITEEKTPVATSPTVDYSLIRMIVEESIKKYASQLKKSAINESQGSNLQLMTKKGNTFRFVTEDGKIFEGKLIYKGNINS